MVEWSEVVMVEYSRWSRIGSSRDGGVEWRWYSRAEMVLDSSCVDWICVEL